MLRQSQISVCVQRVAGIKLSSPYFFTAAIRKKGNPGPKPGSKTTLLETCLTERVRERKREWGGGSIPTKEREKNSPRIRVGRRRSECVLYKQLLSLQAKNSIPASSFELRRPSLLWCSGEWARWRHRNSSSLTTSAIQCDWSTRPDLPRFLGEERSGPSLQLQLRGRLKKERSKAKQSWAKEACFFFARLLSFLPACLHPSIHPSVFALDRPAVVARRRPGGEKRESAGKRERLACDEERPTAVRAAERRFKNGERESERERRRRMPLTATVSFSVSWWWILVDWIQRETSSREKRERNKSFSSIIFYVRKCVTQSSMCLWGETETDRQTPPLAYSR